MARPTKFRHTLGDLDSPALAAQVAGYVSEIELYRQQVEEIQKQIAEVYDDLDEEGFDKAIVRKLVAKRAKGSKADDEAEAIDAYEAAVKKGLSSRARVENPVSYPERVSRPAEIAGSASSLSGNADGQSPVAHHPGEQNVDRSASAQPLSAEGRPAIPLKAGDAGTGQAAGNIDQGQSPSEGEVGSAVRTGAPIPEADPTGDAKPRFTLPPAKPMRPHCRRPDACAGYGSTHCGSCERAAKEARHSQLEDA